MINKEAIEKLKSETKIGDKFGVYYNGKTFKNYTEVVRFNDKSVWLKCESVSRESWNTVLTYLRMKVYQKV
ncbi:MAG: hypothetical protein WC623_22280 [Pedobacter sp.]|uniref:hypothetical protein n=1 Tax=Pedobacter sp. TaxID=1411316 RepID=UPI003567E19C